MLNSLQNEESMFVVWQTVWLCVGIVWVSSPGNILNYFSCLLGTQLVETRSGEKFLLSHGSMVLVCHGTQAWQPEWHSLAVGLAGGLADITVTRSLRAQGTSRARL